MMAIEDDRGPEVHGEIVFKKIHMPFENQFEMGTTFPGFIKKKVSTQTQPWLTAAALCFTCGKWRKPQEPAHRVPPGILKPAVLEATNKVISSC